MGEHDAMQLIIETASQPPTAVNALPLYPMPVPNTVLYDVGLAVGLPDGCTVGWRDGRIVG
jgi:hypothetical protein